VTLDTAASNGAESSTLVRIKSAGTRPHRPFAVFEQCVNEVSGELRILSQLAVFPLCQPFQSANPKRPIPRSKKASNIVIGKVLPGRRLPGDCSNSVES